MRDGVEYAMSDPLVRTLVTFRAAGFNTSDVGQHFLNDDNFGEDVAVWIVNSLMNIGVTVDPEVGQEDHGWYFTFTVDGQDYDFIVGYRANHGPEWIGWLERSVGLIPSLFGGRRRGIKSSAAATIHRVLVASPNFSHIAWHFERDFQDGDENRGTRQPSPNS
jgi:hypothetical protein